jgi:hypothetical protein
MSTKESAVPAAPAETTEEAKNPFTAEGFISEAYEAGELVSSSGGAPSYEKPIVTEDGVEIVDGNVLPDGESKETEPGSQGVATPEKPVQSAERKPDPAAPPKLKATAQERINELTKARHTAEREAERLRQELKDLREGRAPKAEQLPKEEKKETTQEAGTEPVGLAPGEPDPTDAKKYPFGEFDKKYLRDMTDWRVAEKLAERDRQAEERAQQNAVTEHEKSIHTRLETHATNGSKKHEDFIQKVVVESDAWALSDTLAELTAESEVGDEILYYLATHPAESQEIYDLTPAQQARRFGRLETQFISAEQGAATVKTENPALPAPKAPPPIRSAKGASSAPRSPASAENFEEFERLVKSRNTGNG